MYHGPSNVKFFSNNQYASRAEYIHLSQTTKPYLFLVVSNDNRLEVLDLCEDFKP